MRRGGGGGGGGGEGRGYLLADVLLNGLHRFSFPKWPMWPMWHVGVGGQKQNDIGVVQCRTSVC